MVLSYYSNKSKRFHVLIANRVQDIQDKTSTEQWKYNEPKLNPADEASRGMKAQELLDSRWITGPAFMWEKENQWPPSNREDTQASLELNEDDPKVEKSVAMATPQIQRTQTLPNEQSLCVYAMSRA